MDNSKPSNHHRSSRSGKHSSRKHRRHGYEQHGGVDGADVRQGYRTTLDMLNALEGADNKKLRERTEMDQLIHAQKATTLAIEKRNIMRRHTKKSVYVDVEVVSAATDFSVTIDPSFQIEDTSDVYIDYFVTYNAFKASDSADQMGFIADVRFNDKELSRTRVIRNTYSGSNEFTLGIVIPNEATADTGTFYHTKTCPIHLGVLEATTISKISGSITDVGSGQPTAYSTMWNSNARFVMKLTFITRQS